MLYITEIICLVVVTKKGNLKMNEYLTRLSFDRMNPDTKKVLMESIAKRYQMQFLRMEAFHRWGQSCTTGVFMKTKSLLTENINITARPC